jgi:hypothetical protein
MQKTYSVVFGKFTANKAPKRRSLKFRFRDTKLQNVQKRSLFNEAGNNEAILTVDSALYSENLLISKPRRAYRQNFVLGTLGAKKDGVSAMKFESIYRI